MEEAKPSLQDIATKSFFEDLGTALGVPVEALECLASEMNTDKGFDVVDPARLARLWRESGLKPQALEDTLGVLKHIFDFGVRHQTAVDQLLDQIREVCEANDIPGFEERKQILGRILTPSQVFLSVRELMPWSRVAFPNLVGMHGSAELRGAFKGLRSDELRAVVPLAVLRLSLAHDEVKDTKTEHVAFQMPEETVDQLIQVLTLTKRRLAKLRQLVPAGTQVFEHVPGGLWSREEG